MGTVEEKPATGDDLWRMLYCDSRGCRVNTFEHGPWGRCPGCNAEGFPLPEGGRA
ncbi:hypothetical protein PBI_TEAMOCIL_6 [Microbacterium phage Teamocil]|uniref:Uncharacterized protein n=1 Tax=Microbacterium phage Teamocil TaxID=2656554 RepID=A0A649VXH3_9CAUD|nr:hypothetical protein QDA12_gp06 [Microbacterium phage Teamocil]QGJ96958.1 hypothetical protein PBI_TEAMOCIL_6 [Microbacterium phage Teamocil]